MSSKLSSTAIAAIIFLLSQIHSVLSGAVIGTDYVILGVDSFGSLIIPYVGNILNLASYDPLQINYIGLRNGNSTRIEYDAGESASTEPGGKCEGWGIGVDYLDKTKWSKKAQKTYQESSVNVQIYGNNNGSNVALSSFRGIHGGNTAVSTVTNAAGDLYKVTHDYHPSTDCDQAYEVTVTIENISPFDFTNVKYRRAMDWDIHPTPHSEYVTIVGTETTNTLHYSDDNGFLSTLPSVMSTPVVRGTSNVDFEDSGPADHGALFDFEFGSLVTGKSIEFTTFYGVAANEEEAIQCLDDVNAELYSLGQQSGDPIGGEPFTFFFGFAQVSGRTDTPIGNAKGDCSWRTFFSINATAIALYAVVIILDRIEEINH